MLIDVIVQLAPDALVPNELPPVDAAYQSMVAPALAVALKTIAPVPHLLFGVVAVIVGAALTVIVPVAFIAVPQPPVNGIL